MIASLQPDELTLKRSVEKGSEEQIRAVQQIIEQVQSEGDSAIRRLTAELDGVDIPALPVTEEEFEEAWTEVDRDFVAALQEASERIQRYHERQKVSDWMIRESDGTILGQMVQPIERVGLYVPGGKASYPSSVLMNAIPARVAGVDQIVMVTPPQKNGKLSIHTLMAARVAGVHSIYKVGGAQAIAALAFGTKTIPKVDKIVGPGNRYVALAKQAVYGEVDIDSIAGPSEIVVVADEYANPRYIAADLLSQAEHDEEASAILITTSQQIAKETKEQLRKQCAQLERKEIAARSLRNHGASCVVGSLEEAFRIVNQLAPEHVEVLVQNPWNWVGSIRHAGAVFLGESSPETVGDYFAGTNHVLPTNGTARFFSPLGLDQFQKKSSLIAYSSRALQRDGDKIIRLAEAEGLGAHAQSIRIRLEEESS